jgi:hypothetical protein
MLAARRKQNKIIYKLILRRRWIRAVTKMIAKSNAAKSKIRKFYRWRYRQQRVMDEIDGRVQRREEARLEELRRQEEARLEQLRKEEEARL